MQQFVVVTLVSLAAISANVLRSVPVASQSAIKPEIVNGQQATKGQFPWQVAILTLNQELNETTFCGGSIISEEWVITTAHCIAGSAYSIVYSGTIDINDRDRKLSVAEEHIVHENYSENFGDYLFDVGLMKLDEPLVFNDYIKAIPLAEADQMLEPDTDVTISGFGHTTGLFGVINDTNTLLNYIVAPTMNSSECSRYLSYVQTPAIVCTFFHNGDESKIINACTGDGGSPVVLNAESDPVLVAMFSFSSGFGCNYTYPSAHTTIGFYRDWIREISGI